MEEGREEEKKKGKEVGKAMRRELIDEGVRTKGGRRSRKKRKLKRRRRQREREKERKKRGRERERKTGKQDKEHRGSRK